MTKKVLIVSRSLPLPYMSGSLTHMRNFIDYLRTCGFRIQYLYLNMRESVVPPIISGLIDVITAFDPRSGARQNVGFDEPATDNEIAVCKRVFEFSEPDVVIADYCFLSGIFDVIPQGHPAKKIIFFHDSRTRMETSYKSISLVTPPYWNEAKEGRHLSQADAIMVLQAEDEIACRRMVPGVEIIRIGISVKPVPCDPRKQIPGRLIYVGSAATENVMTLINFFLVNCWTPILRQVPHATLIIGGGVGESIKKLLEREFKLPPHTAMTGRIEDLQPFYEEAQVTIIPHAMNGGMKLKLIGALEHGRAVVANRCGIEGLPEAEGTFALVADDPTEFANAVVSILTDDAKRIAMEQAARTFAAEKLSPAACYGGFSAFVNAKPPGRVRPRPHRVTRSGR
jgi:glycosyltransferase involved in cell wall biosynthesis